jgi:hypothetical protein
MKMISNRLEWMLTKAENNYNNPNSINSDPGYSVISVYEK